MSFFRFRDMLGLALLFSGMAMFVGTSFCDGIFKQTFLGAPNIVISAH